MGRLGQALCAAPDDDTNASFRTKSQSFLHGTRNCSEWCAIPLDRRRLSDRISARTIREDPMLTRRGFAGCALCAVTGFVAIGADAQNAPAGLKRTIITRTDGPVDGYETVNVRVDLDAGTLVARHTHPGIESSYVVEGGLELSVDGQGTRTFKAGDGFQVPTGTPHSGKNGNKPTTLAVTYVVEKGKALASPA
jgi:quercetin dioxygenase-like cupin family protein